MSTGTTESAPTTPGHLWRGPIYPAPARVNPWAPPAPQPWAPPAAGVPPLAPAPFPPYPPVARGGSTRRTWALLLGAAALVMTLVTLVAVIAAAGGSRTTAGPRAHRPSASELASPSTTTTTAPVQAEELPALLLDVATINTVMGTRDLAVNPTLTTTRLYIDTTDKPECGGVWANANKGVYAGSGWVSVQTQYLREPTDPRHEVFQSVVSFPTAAAATDFVSKEGKNWPLCNGRSITTTTPNSPPQSWWVATVSQRNSVLTSVVNREGGHGWGCQHALTSRNNVVVDIETCGFEVQQQASEIAGKVAQGIH